MGTHPIFESDFDCLTAKGAEMQLRWGICSTAKISNDFCVGLATLPAENHKVVAVAARGLKSAQDFAATHKIEKAYEGYDCLASDSSVDIVYIGSINSAHYDLCMKFISCGKHVLCEKTLGLNEKQTTEIYAAAKKAKVFMMEAMWSRTLPTYKKVKSMLRNGDIGTVRFAQSSFGFPIMVHDRIKEKSMGGGSLLDLGVYSVMAVLLAFNDEEPLEVSASGTVAETGVDETVVITLKYSDGRVGVATCCARAQLHNEALICGDSGIIRFMEPFHCGEKIEVQKFAETGKNAKEPLPLEEFTFPHPKTDMFMNFVNSTGLSYEAEDVRQCLIKGLLENPDWSHELSTRVSRILTKARLSLGCRFDIDK